MSTKALRNLIAAVALLLTVTACGGGTGASGDKGGVLRIGTSKAAWIFSATALQESIDSTSLSRTTNSSPPRRATMSLFRTAD